jgi:hypothetical protein
MVPTVVLSSKTDTPVRGKPVLASITIPLIIVLSVTCEYEFWLINKAKTKQFRKKYLLLTGIISLYWDRRDIICSYADSKSQSK